MSLGSNFDSPRGLIVSNDLLRENINISKTSKGILIKLHSQHHCVEGKVTYCFSADRTGTLVAMAT